MDTTPSHTNYKRVAARIMTNVQQQQKTVPVKIISYYIIYILYYINFYSQNNDVNEIK